MLGKMCAGHKVAMILLWVGGVNWGLVGAFKFNLVEWLVGRWPLLVSIIYVIVGLSAIFMLFSGKCKACKAEIK